MTTEPELQRSFRGHTKEINSVALDPLMRQVASASNDSLVYIWSFDPTQRPFKFAGHKGHVNAITFSPDS